MFRLTLTQQWIMSGVEQVTTISLAGAFDYCKCLSQVGLEDNFRKLPYDELLENIIQKEGITSIFHGLRFNVLRSLIHKLIFCSLRIFPHIFRNTRFPKLFEIATSCVISNTLLYWANSIRNIMIVDRNLTFISSLKKIAHKGGIINFFRGFELSITSLLFCSFFATYLQEKVFDVYQINNRIIHFINFIEGEENDYSFIDNINYLIDLQDHTVPNPNVNDLVQQIAQHSRVDNITIDNNNNEIDVNNNNNIEGDNNNNNEDNNFIDHENNINNDNNIDDNLINQNVNEEEEEEVIVENLDDILNENIIENNVVDDEDEEDESISEEELLIYGYFPRWSDFLRNVVHYISSRSLGFMLIRSCTFPLEFTARMMQVDCVSFSQAVNTTYSSGGWKSFYRGLPFELIKIPLQVTTSIVISMLLSRLFLYYNGYTEKPWTTKVSPYIPNLNYQRKQTWLETNKLGIQ